MSYLSLYRKYRSQTFGDLIGQDHVVRTVQNGISSGRIAHSYLFTGPRGTGKTSTARLLAKALCCEHGPTPEPDNTCHICEAITAGNCVDVIEMDAASESGVDDIREQIVEVTEYQPMMCRYKVFIIDEVHDLSPKAFDALLKTVEEPPPHIIFILATTEFNKVPPTIRSRCQKYEFHRASMNDLVSRLSYVAEHEGVQVDPPAIAAIARMADGGYRDALTLLEQAILTSEEGRITLQQVYDQLGLVPEEVVDGLLLAIKEADVPRIMDLLAEVARLGRDPRAILESMLFRLADLTRASYQVPAGTQEATREASLHETAARLGRDFILRLRGGLAEAHKVIRDISLPRLWLESELVRLSMPTPAPIVAVPAIQPASARREASAAVGAREAPVVSPEREPEPAAVAVAPPPPSELPSSNGSANSDDGHWSAILEELGAVSRTLGMKLIGSRLVGNDGSKVTVEFNKESFYDWVRERPKVVAEITRCIQAKLGHHYTIDLLLSKQEPGSVEPVAVELPAEGQRLEQLAREVFGAQPPQPPTS